MEKAPLVSEKSHFSFLWAFLLGRPWLGEASSVHQNWWGISYLFTVNVDNIFGSRIFLPQWGPFWILQKGHYGLRKRTKKGKVVLARGNQEPAPPPCPETHVPGEGLHVAQGQRRGGRSVILLPTDITAEGPKIAPPPPPPKFFSHVTPYSGQLIHNYCVASWTEKRRFETIHWLIQTRDTLMLLLSLISSRKPF